MAALCGQGGFVAHSLSARKRHRQSLRRQQRNRAGRTEARSAVSAARAAIVSGSAEEAQAAVQKAASVLDRTARKGVIHSNNASRRKHRLMRQLNRQSTAPEAPAKGRGRGTRKKS
jgi:small subunit ribosomal protein S20